MVQRRRKKLYSWLSNIRYLQFDQDSQVQPVSKLRGVSLSVMNIAETENLVCNIV